MNASTDAMGAAGSVSELSRAAVSWKVLENEFHVPDMCFRGKSSGSSKHNLHTTRPLFVGTELIPFKLERFDPSVSRFIVGNGFRR